jgi:hypothetical protein
MNSLINQELPLYKFTDMRRIIKLFVLIFLIVVNHCTTLMAEEPGLPPPGPAPATNGPPGPPHGGPPISGTIDNSLLLLVVFALIYAGVKIYSIRLQKIKTT